MTDVLAVRDIILSFYITLKRPLVVARVQACFAFVLRNLDPAPLPRSLCVQNSGFRGL